MKKSWLFSLAVLPCFLVSCQNVGTLTSAVSSSAASSKSTNTLTSVLSSFGNNLTVNASFAFLGGGTSVPVLNTAYEEKGCYFKYTNFGDAYSSFGLVDVAEGAKTGVDKGTYTWTLPDSAAGSTEAIVLGKKLSADASFRTLYDDPSMIGVNYQTFVDAFVPEIAGTTSGYFDLNNANLTQKSATSSSDASVSVAASSVPFVDRSAELKSLCQYLGVYEILTSVKNLSLDYASLYFAENGTSFTFNVYSKYQNGYNGLKTVVVVSKIGRTAISAMDTYLSNS